MNLVNPRCACGPGSLVVDSELLGSRVCAVPATDGFTSGGVEHSHDMHHSSFV